MRKKVTVKLGRRGGAKNHPGGSIKATGNIHRADGHAAHFQRLDHRKRLAVQGPRKTRAKYRVDHDTGAFETLRREWQHKGPFQRLAAWAASPLSLSREPSRANFTGQPAAAR